MRAPRIRNPGGIGGEGLGRRFEDEWDQESLARGLDVACVGSERKWKSLLEDAGVGTCCRDLHDRWLFYCLTDR